MWKTVWFNFRIRRTQERLKTFGRFCSLSLISSTGALVLFAALCRSEEVAKNIAQDTAYPHIVATMPIGNSLVSIKLKDTPASQVLNLAIQQNNGFDAFPLILGESAASSLAKRPNVTFDFVDVPLLQAVKELSVHFDFTATCGLYPLRLSNYAEGSQLVHSYVVPPMLVFAERVQEEEQPAIQLAFLFLDGDVEEARPFDAEARLPSGDWQALTDRPRRYGSGDMPHVYPVEGLDLRGVRGKLAAIVAKERLVVYVDGTTPGETSIDGLKVNVGKIQASNHTEPPKSVAKQKEYRDRTESIDSVWYWLQIDFQWPVLLSAEEHQFMSSFILVYPKPDELPEKMTQLQSMEDRAQLYSYVSTWGRVNTDSPWTKPPGPSSDASFDRSEGRGKVLLYSDTRKKLEKYFKIDLARMGFMLDEFSIDLEHKSSNVSSAKK